MNDNKKRIACFGELLLRLSPMLNKEWIATNQIPCFIGGAELNVATALAKWGMDVKYISALPQNYLAEEIIDQLQQFGINTQSIIRSGERIGTYYLAQGKDLKNAGVIYDRKYSSFSELKPNTIHWSELLGDAEWLHFGAINPALNENIVALCHEALQAAQQKGMMVSIDLNYRSKLWQYGKKPIEVMPEIVNACDIIMGNIWAAHHLLGIPVKATEKFNKAEYLEHSTFTANTIMERFPKCKIVSNTFRFDNGKGIDYYASFHQGKFQFVSKSFNLLEAKDKIGSGDCFMAGLIYGISHHLASQDIINFAAAAAIGKLREVGDATQQTVNDVLNTIQEYGH
jgi:2-dehydro-3-deoxygluconokinase